MQQMTWRNGRLRPRTGKKFVLRILQAYLEGKSSTEFADQELARMRREDRQAKMHYHVSAGFPGCIPEYNEVFESLQDARESMGWHIEPYCVQGGNRFDCIVADKENGEYFYQQRGKYAIFYVQIFPCSDCEIWEEYQREEG